MELVLLTILLVLVLSTKFLKTGLNPKAKLKQNIWLRLFQSKRERRRNYYRNDYLKSDTWKRKRYVVLKRDNWRCVYCGAKATEVHHKKYLKKNIGKEPIEWLVSVCRSCHQAKHNFFRKRFFG